jgi:hypothetical protein
VAERLANTSYLMPRQTDLKIRSFFVRSVHRPNATLLNRSNLDLTIITPQFRENNVILGLFGVFFII